LVRLTVFYVGATESVALKTTGLSHHRLVVIGRGEVRDELRLG